MKVLGITLYQVPIRLSILPVKENQGQRGEIHEKIMYQIE